MISREKIDIINVMAEEMNVVGLASSKKGGKVNTKIIAALIGIIVLAGGIVAGILLVKQQQDIREKAESSVCPGAEDCAETDPQLLRSCHSADTDWDGQDTNDSFCDSGSIGRSETCGASFTNYCCNGSVWVTDMTLCENKATATATATATGTAEGEATPTGTGTAKGTPTGTGTGKGTATATGSGRATAPSTTRATRTATSTSSATEFPVPTTGFSLPTLVGMGFGILLIVGSLLIAL